MSGPGPEPACPFVALASIDNIAPTHDQVLMTIMSKGAGSDVPINWHKTVAVPGLVEHIHAVEVERHLMGTLCFALLGASILWRFVPLQAA